MPRPLTLSVLVAQVLAAGVARASVPDVFGLGSEESAVGGASAARVHDASAAHYNPAGLAALERPEMSVGVVGFGSLLSAGGRRQTIADPFGFTVAAATPVPLGMGLGRRLFVGIALFTLPGAVVHVIARAPEEPFFPYYDNRTQRLVLLPSLALRLGWGLSLGVAGNYLAGLAGRIEAREGATRAVEPRVDEQILSTLRLNAGLRWHSSTVALAFVYRQSFSVPFTTVAHTSVAGQPIDLSVDAEGLYTPDELVLGGAWRARPWLLLSLDGQASLWSRWRGPYVTVASVLPLAGALSAPPPHLQFEDAFALRLGAELSRPLSSLLEGRARLGLGAESSPVPTSQPGVTNLLDGEKLFLSAGGGVRVRAREVVLRLDVHAQMHIVRERTLVKVLAPAGSHPDPATALRDEVTDDPARPETLGAQVSNPGWPRISGGGAVWAAGLTLTVER